MSPRATVCLIDVCNFLWTTKGVCHVVLLATILTKTKQDVKALKLSAL